VEGWLYLAFLSYAFDAYFLCNKCKTSENCYSSKYQVLENMGLISVKYFC